ncbi:MAG: DinB family protein [Bacteroidota bacterium]
MKEVLFRQYKFNLLYAEALVVDIEEHQMTITPSKGLENHPAFTLGHLISAAALTSRYLGGPYNFSPEWEKLFKRNGPGDPTLPETDAKLYPEKQILLDELKKQHGIVENLIADLDDAKLDETVKWRFYEYMSTVRDMLYFMCVSHESMHLSQLAAWRRAMGLPSALARL